MITFIQELKMASETGRMSVSVTPEKQQKLDAIASSLDRSRNWLVNQAIDNYLEIYDWQTKKSKNAWIWLREKMYSSIRVMKLMPSSINLKHEGCCMA